MTRPFWWAVGVVTGLLSAAAAWWWQELRPAELVCPICDKPFSCHRDEIDAAMVYHEEFDCEGEV